MDIFTIGHSTQPIEAFIHMLQTAHIEVLADVRAFPASRKYPQFNQANLKASLEEYDITYVHIPLLAGRRNKSELFQDELNSGWQNQSFHNYADYSLTDDFQEGIMQLTKIARHKKTAYCCSERHPARCHRLLISNYLAANEWAVHHIIPQNAATTIVDHQLGQWGAMPIIEESGTVVYPPLENEEAAFSAKNE